MAAVRVVCAPENPEHNVNLCYSVVSEWPPNVQFVRYNNLVVSRDHEVTGPRKAFYPRCLDFKAGVFDAAEYEYTRYDGGVKEVRVYEPEFRGMNNGWHYGFGTEEGALTWAAENARLNR